MALTTWCFLTILFESTLPTSLIEAVMIASSGSTSILISGRVQVKCFVCSISHPISSSVTKMRVVAIEEGWGAFKRIEVCLFHVSWIRNLKMIVLLFIMSQNPSKKVLSYAFTEVGTLLLVLWKWLAALLDPKLCKLKGNDENQQKPKQPPKGWL